LPGFCFGAGINRNNVINLACRFKSSATTQIQQAKISRQQEAFAASRCAIREIFSWRLLELKTGRASLRQRLVARGVFRVHFGPLYRVGDDGGRTRGALCPSTAALIQPHRSADISMNARRPSRR
jgi:hypothetical protein